MQTTLLGLAIAIIVALVAALVGPLMIDWGGYRALFEREATQLVGLPVHVTGAIDARLLPTPRVTLHDVEIGGADTIRARAFGVEFALAPLMRGEWKASELRLVGPQLNLGLDAEGHVQAPKLAIGFDPDALTIDRLRVEDGTLTVSDAGSGSKLTLDRFWFNGDAHSLLGPFKGEGAATVGGDLYPFRLTVGRYGADGKLKLRVNIDPVSRPLSIQADGALTLGGDQPRFDGNLKLARAVSIAAGSKTELRQPWHIAGKLKVTPASALMQDFEFQYGSEDKGVRLTGDADFKFGRQPHFDGVLSARQIDLDRALSGADGTQPPPAAAIRKIAELAGGAFRPAIPIQLGIGIDQITLGGNTVQSLRGDISTNAQGWNLDRFEFRAPGFTQVRLSGRLAVDNDRVAFTGPAELKTNNPKALTAWLEGRAPADKGELRPMSLRGDVTLASDKIALDHLGAEIGGNSMSGRFAYYYAAGARPARLDAALKAPSFDIDAAFGFGKALLAGSTVARPRDMTIAADIGQATLAGLAARDLSARLNVDADGLRIDKLSVADLGGASFSASGRIVTEPSPQGDVRVDLNAPDMTPVRALLARFAPQTARVLAHGAPAMAPVKLHANLTVQGAAPATRATLSVGGNLGKVQLALNGESTLDRFTPGNVHLSGKLGADDGRLLVAALGLDRIVAPEAGPGTFSFDAKGPLRGDLTVDGRLSAGGLDVSTSGTASPFADSPAAALRADIVHADLAPLRRGAGAQAALPVTLSARIALAGNDLSLNDMTANIAGAKLRGKLAATLAAPHRVQGEIEADRVDGAALVAAAIGTPAAIKATQWSWTDAPFANGIFADATGSIALKARRADLLPPIAMREVSATLTFGRNQFTLDDLAGDMAGGRLTGRLSFRSAQDGLTTQAKLALAGADMNALLPSGARPPLTGTLALAVEAEGSGLSPVALVGALRGTGTFTLSDARFAGLDPRAFDAVTHTVDKGQSIDAARISDIANKALESGALAVKRAEGTFAVGAGEVRLTKFDADSEAAKLALAGSLDLTGGALDARLVLSGPADGAGVRPDIFMALKGPVTAPQRSIDVSALTGWLTLRAVENQTKQLRKIEQERATEPPRSSTAPKSEVPAARTAPMTATLPAPKKTAVPAHPSKPKPAPVHTSRRQRAPALPPPVVVTPPPGGAGRETSAIGAQR